MLIDCEAYQRKERASKDFDQLGPKSKESGVETTQVNAAISGGGVKSRKGVIEERKGVMVQTIEVEVIMDRCMTVINLSLTRTMVSQEGDIVVVITIRATTHTIPIQGTTTICQTTVNSNIPFNQDIKQHTG